MSGRELIRLLTSRKFGCAVIRQRGSHVIVQCGDCRAVVPVHGKTGKTSRRAPGPTSGHR